MKKQTINDWVTLDLALGNPVILDSMLFELPAEYQLQTVIEVTPERPTEVIQVIRRDNEGREVKYNSVAEASKASNIPSIVIEKNLQEYRPYSKYQWFKKVREIK